MFKKYYVISKERLTKREKKNYSQWKKNVLFNKPKIEALIITNIIIAKRFAVVRY